MRLKKNLYQNKEAIVILGGTSIDSYLNKLNKIDKKRFIIFIEPKALQLKLLKKKIIPDYLLCPFSNKMKDNTLQNLIFRSLVVNVDIKKFIKDKYFYEVDYIKKNFNKFYEIWNPKKGLHKKYKYKKNVFLKDSPFSLLKYFKNTKIILEKEDFFKQFSNKQIKNEVIKIKTIETKNFIKKIFKLKLSNGNLIFYKTNFLNSVTMYHLPLMDYLGFKKIYFLGLDMNFFGTYGYNNLEIFKTKLHFYYFLFLIRKTLNYNFKFNFPIYLRPQEEFENLNELLDKKRKFYRVVNKLDNLIPKMNNIKISDFLTQIK